MSALFDADLKQAMVDHINHGLDYGTPKFTVDDITDVQVRWDDGDRWDPTYGDHPNAAPTFEVLVSLRDGPCITVDPAFTFTALLRLVLGVNQ